MKLSLKKVGVQMIPDDPDTADYLNKLKMGEVVVADFKKPRNYNFHKKYFALIKYSFDNWEPIALEDSKWEGVVPEKSFERFRKDLIILAGRYNAVYRIDGSLRIEAQSISFAKMDSGGFAELYDATINVILNKILTNYTRDDLDRVIEELERFY
jgi:hypothetical protein